MNRSVLRTVEGSPHMCFPLTILLPVGSKTSAVTGEGIVSDQIYFAFASGKWSLLVSRIPRKVTSRYWICNRM